MSRTMTYLVKSPSAISVILANSARAATFRVKIQNAMFSQAWAIVEKERGNYDQATSLFEAGVRADPNHLYLWQAWGCMEVEQVSVNKKSKGIQ